MGFLAPIFLLALVSLLVLLLIYLRARSRPTLEVPSILLFDELPAPAVRARFFRLDPIFWLKAAALAALSLALAGMYLVMRPQPARSRTRALVFDLGAGMGAQDGAHTRLEAAKAEAKRLIAAASPLERFDVIGYALEARVYLADSADRHALSRAIGSLSAMAVAARPAALSAALIRARGTQRIDLFTDRSSPAAAAQWGSRVRLHRIGHPVANFAIVSLDPGSVGQSRGHCVLRSFSNQPGLIELVIMAGGATVLDRTLLMAPREQLVVSFGPLTHGGLVHARIVTPDGLAADNGRYAFAPGNHASRVLVLSSDASVRDDLARTLLALDQNFVVTTADPRSYHASPAGKPFKMAVMHDCYVAGVNAAAHLFIYPPLRPANLVPGLSVRRGYLAAEMSETDTSGVPGAPVLLEATRAIAVPSWMRVVAHGTAPNHDPIALAALGLGARGRYGVIAFDPRGHLLLDPDRLGALVTTLDMMRALTAPAGLQIVSTGKWISVPATGRARVLAPDGTVSYLRADESGRVRIRPLEAGQYRVASASGSITLYANYYDAAESDLIASTAPSAPTRAQYVPPQPAAGQPRPIALGLIALALVLMVAESVLVIRRMRFGVRHV